MSAGPHIPAFLGAGPRPGARWALFGAPLDATVSFRPGSRFGPPAIRAASAVLEEWSPALGHGLEPNTFCDLGDLEFAPGDVDGALAQIAGLVGNVADEGPRPLMLGGEHLVTLPAVEALAARHSGLRVVQFDAHADLREDYMGRAASHATVMRRVVELIGPRRLYQLGIRSGTADEWSFGAAETRFAPGELRLSDTWRAELASGPVYVTVDIDCVDPAYAPGTGTPEPGGPSSRELLSAIALLQGLVLVGADVVEVAPLHDPAGITAALAAKVVRELLLLDRRG